jgi:hypothetical protein
MWHSRRDFRICDDVKRMFGIRVYAIGAIATVQVVAKPSSQRGMRNSSVATREQPLDTSALQAVPALDSPTVTVTTPGPHTDNVLSTAAPATGQTVEGGGHTVVRRPTLTEILMALPKDSTNWTRQSAKVEPESSFQNTLFAYDQ